ncbi:MAG: arginine--tRNA ligase [Candidatus Chisholmbacteria bacterium RIFCSPHIGHO2_01_FULL_49_18]|uniref:Arginine--tRNA ligase n=2 Tax=Candidatus Chisholmiibacteriota TaxID=1817900 RepID=A0A1G1VMA8_9BACT|nr:MAG: arginine--tRNA ligase [Candidatus Chisholmbacteria bacterium RIFCSPHIGHO2_01_FULL_49_18]OGY21010.1 MAG: arginine--tRNA ligase [Candidatus Chisholmbacteria bacterium RIFCSPLOWO2_01_FULL_49_14]
MFVDELKLQIKKALKALNLPQVDITLEHPADEAHGDYATNVALKLHQQLHRHEARSMKHEKISQVAPYKTPREIAKAIADYFEFRISDFGFLHKVEVAGPGFINFWISEHFLLDELKRILDLGDKYGENALGKGKKILLEFTDPNPFKEFHIGHLYSNIVGESLARLLEATGATVKRANYQGDVGLHVAKAIFGLLQIQNSKLQIQKWEKKALEERVKILGRAYAMGARAYEEDEGAKKEIKELNSKIYAQDPEIQELYNKGREWSLEYFESIYKRLGTAFDFYYFEREAGKIGLELVKQHLKDGIFEESQGAIVFPGEKHGLHTRVFINSQGLPTYEAKDLGLALTKYQDFAFDESVIITGNEVDEYFRVVLKALSLINPALGQKTKHISHGMVRLPGGKMSSRTGDVITGEWLLDEAKGGVTEIIQKAGSLDKSIQDSVAETVGLGAVKYALLKSSIGRDIVFDFKESVSFEGNSGPYLQYTYARARSVLSQAKNSTFKVGSFKGIQLNAEELSILRWLYRYPEAVDLAAQEFSPNVICGYLFELAQRFNAFYNKHRILQAKEKGVRAFRMQLTTAVSQILSNGLFLLGIKAPRKM